MTRTTLGRLFVAGVALVLVGSAVGTAATSASPSITITVDADGDATWTVTNTMNLSTDADRAAFDELANNESRKQALLERTVALYRDVANQSGQHVGRPMPVSARSITFERTGDTGVISVTFRWRQFARTDGDGVVVGDVFAGGFPLEAGRTLTIEGPDGYRLASHNVSTDAATVDGGAVTWDGPARLSADSTLAFAAATPTPRSTPTAPSTSGSTTPTRTPTATPEATETPGESGPGFGVLLALLAIAAAAVLAVGRDGRS